MESIKGHHSQQQKGTDSYRFLQIEMQLMKIIEDSYLNGRGIMSVDELISALGSFDSFTLRRQILTLEGKGLVKKSERGYMLTEKGKQKLQDFLQKK
ncbi:hypothetical protein [Candidatus Nitrososphaera gargensis]|nr:hypothetical protein [Candidatus Nitrososphaera gargensis]